MKSTLPQAGHLIPFFRHESFHLFVCPAVDYLIDAVSVKIFLDQLIRPESLATYLAVHLRIIEVSHMAGSFPRLRIHQNRGIQTYIVSGLLNKFLSPGRLDIIF